MFLTNQFHVKNVLNLENQRIVSWPAGTSMCPLRFLYIGHSLMIIENMNFIDWNDGAHWFIVQFILKPKCSLTHQKGPNNYISLQVVVGMAHHPQRQRRAKWISPIRHTRRGRTPSQYIGQLVLHLGLSRMRKSRPHNGPRKVAWWTPSTEVYCAPKLPTKEEKITRSI